MSLECQFGIFLEDVLLFLYNCESLAHSRLSGKQATATLSRFKYREETLTEAIVSLGNQQFPVFNLRAFSVPRESSISGADLLLVLKSKNVNLSLLMQSKRPRAPITSMLGPWDFDLGSTIPKGKTVSHYDAQRTLLLKHAPVLNAVPVYGFYCPDKSQSSCNQKPGLPADFGALHLVKVSTISTPIFAPGTPMPGTTLSNLLCCPGLIQRFMTDLQDKELSEQELFRFVSGLAEVGEAPANILLVDFSEAVD